MSISEPVNGIPTRCLTVLCPADNVAGRSLQIHAENLMYISRVEPTGRRTASVPGRMELSCHVKCIKRWDEAGRVTTKANVRNPYLLKILGTGLERLVGTFSRAGTEKETPLSQPLCYGRHSNANGSRCLPASDAGVDLGHLRRYTALRWPVL